ncbi:Phospholipase A-2-activating protein, partial [Sarcoptes scabiei]
KFIVRFIGKNRFYFKKINQNIHIMENFRFFRLDKIHSDSIRSMVCYNNHQIGLKQIVTVSRDSEAKIFNVDEKGLVNFLPEFTFNLPTQISTVCVLDDQKLPLPIFVFGCMNGQILVFLGFDQNASQSIESHEKNVCIIRSDASKIRVASGSWDHTVTVFKVDCNLLIQLFKIIGHSESVMDLVFVGLDSILTASSDHSIILWNIDSQTDGKMVQSYLGHSDCVRALLLDEDSQSFYSVSNDQSIRFWNLSSSTCLKTYVGHEHFIFNITRLSSDYFISCGENNSVIIWNQNQSKPWQKLQLPSVTVWCVIATNLNVFYAAGSDGVLYIFTNHPELQTDLATQQLFEESLIRQTKIPFSSVAHLKLYEENSLKNIAPKEIGDRRLIRSAHDDIVLVYEWNRTWKAIGHVPDYQHQEFDFTTGKVPYNDEYFDEVFSVKLNNKSYRLPFNRDQNPWDVAQSFIETNELEYDALTYLVQCIVNYASYKPKKLNTSQVDLFPIYEFKLWTNLPNLEAFRKKFQDFNQTIDDDSIRLPDEVLQIDSNQINHPEEFATEFCEIFQKLFKWPNEKKFIVYDLLRILLVNKYFNSS